MTEIAERLLSKTIDDGGCLVWQHATVNSHPAVTIKGKSLLVRRVIWAELKGPLRTGEIIRSTCGTPGCINAEHLIKTTHAALARENGQRGLMGGLVRSASIAKAKRASSQAKLSESDVRALRNSTEHVPTLAARLGISESHAYRVRRHDARRDHFGPFAGLLA